MNWFKKWINGSNVCKYKDKCTGYRDYNYTCNNRPEEYNYSCYTEK